MPLRYDAVLLDIDGTLVDSNDAEDASAWSDAFATHAPAPAAEWAPTSPSGI